jgi:anti-sigma factor RsiW
MSDCDDLNWLAFRYVAGELSTDELLAFETRMEADQDAREAVAQTTALTCFIASADEVRVDREPASARALVSPVTSAPSPRESSRGWAISLAVSAVLLLSITQLPRPENAEQFATLSGHEATAADQLAEVWDALREPLDDTTGSPELLDDDNLDLPVAMIDPTSDDGRSFWIEAAVMGLAEAGGNE